MPTFKSVGITTKSISFHFSDNRIIIIPLDWVPKLKNATKDVRESYIIRNHFVFWESIDEIIGVKNLLNGSIVPKWKPHEQSLAKEDETGNFQSAQIRPVAPDASAIFYMQLNLVNQTSMY